MKDLIFSFLLAALLSYLSIFVIYYIYFRFFKHIVPYSRFPDQRVKDRFLYKIFFAFPRRFVLDRLQFDPNYFRYQGCIVFTGRQGSGKTIALVKQVRDYQLEYPSCKVLSNLSYKFEDDHIDDWRPLLTYKNGIYGVVVCLDELQNWFSSNQSKDFPPEMLEVITQNRKNRRIILGTSQVFTRLSKPIREQVSEIRECITLFGCWTFVFRFVPELDFDGSVLKRKFRGFYSFVQSEELRSMYDTYAVIDSLAKSGFKENLQSNLTILGGNVPGSGYPSAGGGRIRKR